LDRLATKVMEVKDGGVVVYPGTFAEYVRDKEEREGRAKPVATNIAVTPTVAFETSNGMAAAVVQSEFAGKEKIKRLNPIKLKQMEDRCAFLEEEVPRIEASIAHTEGALGNYVSATETERQSALLGELRGQLAQFTAEWEELTMALEEQSALS
jgi:ATP-binding cassette subfamily F protein 3